MGAKFSTIEYREQVMKFSTDFLTSADSEVLTKFLMMSDDFYNVVTTVMLDEFRRVKIEKTDNLIYLMSFVSAISLTSHRQSNQCMTSRFNIRL